MAPSAPRSISKSRNSPPLPTRIDIGFSEPSFWKPRSVEIFSSPGQSSCLSITQDGEAITADFGVEIGQAVDRFLVNAAIVVERGRRDGKSAGGLGGEFCHLCLFCFQRTLLRHSGMRHLAQARNDGGSKPPRAHLDL